MKNEKGITLLSLIVTIIVMLIITGTTVYTSVNRFKINNLKKMYNDIELLDDKVENYYVQYGGLPIKDKYTLELNFNKDANDNENYNIIDLAAIGDITLNYGKEGYENPNTSDDVYVINEKSHTIYYVKGIESSDGKIYHSIKIDENENADTIPPTKPEINIVSETDTSIELEVIPGKDNVSGIEKTEYTITSTDMDKQITTDSKQIGERTVISNLDKNKAHEITAITASKNGLKSENTFTLNKWIKDVKIGDYVNYEERGQKSITIEKGKSGYDKDQIISQEDDLNWRVLGVNAKGELELISDKPTSQSISLKGENGYLHGPDELNRICKELYGKGTHASGARSLNVEDINKLANYDPTKEANDYGKQCRLTQGSHLLDGRIVNASEDSPVMLKCDYYMYIPFGRMGNQAMTNLIPWAYGNSETEQWLSSKCINCKEPNFANYYVRAILVYDQRMKIDGYLMLGNSTNQKNNGLKARPVVSLKFNVQIDTSKENGKNGSSPDKAYEIK